MLISTLRNIGLATMGDQDEIDVLLEDQWKDMKKSEKLIICEIDFDKNDFSLEMIDNSQINLRKILPGITSDTSKNYSPVVKIHHSISFKNKKFSSLAPESILKLDKISNFESSKDKDTICSKFGLWLKLNRTKLQEKLYIYFKQNFLIQNNKEETVIERNAPAYLAFKFRNQNEVKYTGEYPEFQKTYINRKKRNQKAMKIVNLPDDAICMTCGENKDTLFSLQALKFLDLFSLDQTAFQLHFQGNKNSLQALICMECETLVRKGYSEINTTLRFLAYKQKVSMKKTKYVYHSLIPLYNNSSNINRFIRKIRNFREQYYDVEKKSFEKKISYLKEELEKGERKKKKELQNQINRLEKNIELNEKKGYIESTNSINYLELIKEAKERNVGLMDFFYQEVQDKGKKKKIVESILYGDKHRISLIVDWIESMKEKHKSIVFDLNKLILTFGEKTGKLILQSLFTGRELNKSVLFKSVYDFLWSRFRETLVTVDEERRLNRYFLREGIKLFHYIIDLLYLANILR